MRADPGENRVTDGSVAHRLEAMVREAFGPAHAFRALPPDQHRDEPVVLVGGALLYDDNDVIEASVTADGNTYRLDDCGEGAWRRMLGRVDEPDESRVKTCAEIAERWGVAFKQDSMAARCEASGLVATAYRVMLASREIARRGPATGQSEGMEPRPERHHGGSWMYSCARAIWRSMRAALGRRTGDSPAAGVVVIVLWYCASHDSWSGQAAFERYHVGLCWGLTIGAGETYS